MFSGLRRSRRPRQFIDDMKQEPVRARCVSPMQVAVHADDGWAGRN